MRHRKAQQLANDKAYQLLVEKLPKKFEPLEKRHPIYVSNTPDRKILNKEKRRLNKEIDARNEARIKAAKESGYHRLARICIDQGTPHLFWKKHFYYFRYMWRPGLE